MKNADNDFNTKLSTLSTKERLYFSMMKAQSGVLYIKSKPGIAKSAIARNIANKLGFQYIDLRLSMLDETDIGLYPMIKTDERGTSYIKYAIPEWAIRANENPTIIHFEELNRAQLNIRNAALQILHERCIGFDFCFNDNVYMMASGNLGEDDGTDVEEFDAALNNRLIHKMHNLTVPEWVEGFARENVHPLIVKYIESNPSEFYHKSSENHPAYATPRSWTFLSDFIVQNFSMTSQPEEFLGLTSEVADSYIGNSAAKFIRYMDDLKQVTVNDMLDRYEDVKERIEVLGRAKKSELVNEVRAMDIKKLKKKQMDNLVLFLKTLNEDELTTYLLEVLDRDDWDTEIKKEKSNIKRTLDEFKKEYKMIKEITNKEQ